ncbi:hypothetical protein [Demequina activiva]|uniref:Uncharacterized protein n=1 Tax=Demequina activiva TaxID=1582364 RepID=A0A919Q508_9MICO|nr:hypothetical protein [Demequina activiva]GIG54623.1 hypothetical protein Dac01nite_13750 [Demequina activiva]
MMDRNRSWRESDEGVAMVMVLGIMLVGAVIMTTVAAATMFTVERTQQTRVEERAYASADAGIDLIFTSLEGLQYDELSSICSNNSLVMNGDDVALAYEFTVSDGTTTSTKACPGPGDLTTRLVVTATATTPPVVLDGDPVQRTVAASFSPTIPPGILDKALFSEATLTMRNNTDLLESTVNARDAHVYSNGGITCSTNEHIEGSIVAAHGDVRLENTCDIFSDVWASGSVIIDSSGADIDGNVYAAGDAAEWGIAIKNSGSRITGSALTNGGILLQNSKAPQGGIGGIAFSFLHGFKSQQATIDGSLYVQTGVEMEATRISKDVIVRSGNLSVRNNQAYVDGQAWASGAIHPQLNITPANRHPGMAVGTPDPSNPSTASASFNDAVGYPSRIQAPRRVPMDQITMTAADISRWTDDAGYTLVTATDCSTAGSTAIVNNAGTVVGPRLIIFNCPPNTPVQFDNANLVLTSDVAMVSNTGFRSRNDLRVRSADGSERLLYWIVPADAPGVSWATGTFTQGQETPTCSDNGSDGWADGSIWMAKFQNIQDVAQLIYTPCKFESQNSIPASSDPFKGQVYAGSLAQTNGWEQEMFSMPVPSLVTTVPDLDDEADMRLSSRFDIRG